MSAAHCTEQLHSAQYRLRPTRAGGGQTHGDLDGHQQQELLAPVAVEGDAGGDDERLVEGTGPGEYP